MLLKLLTVILTFVFIYMEIKTFKKMKPVYDKYGNDVEYYRVTPGTRRACMASSVILAGFFLFISAGILTNNFGQGNPVEALEKRIAEAEKACGVSDEK